MCIKLVSFIFVIGFNGLVIAKEHQRAAAERQSREDLLNDPEYQKGLDNLMNFINNDLPDDF